MFLRRLQFLIRKEFLTTLKNPKTRAILIVPVPAAYAALLVSIALKITRKRVG